MGRKKWAEVRYDKERAAELAQITGEEPFAVLLALSRGFDTPETLRDFFHAKTLALTDPFLIRDMDKGVRRIRDAVDAGERILVYGDYDADGVTATALLYTYLQSVGADVDFYIPSRVEDGYGLSLKTAERVLQGGFQLVVTVDNGIAAVEEAAFFKENGIDLVVTDHHQAGDTLPDCAAVIDPHRPDDTSPFKELAGVGVALKVAAAMEDGDHTAVLEDYLDLVTLGTVADIVPLTGENRTLVANGLSAIRNTSRPGLRLLLDRLNPEGRPVTSSTVAYQLAPRINAAGRMDSAEAALELLITEDFDRAAALVETLEQANAARKASEAQILKQVTQLLAEHPSYRNDPVLVVSGKDWHPGVIGIVASRLTEEYGKPAFVISGGPEGDAKGSCRSFPGFSLYDALSACADTLTKFGGHTQAAGFSVEESRIGEFRRAINRYAAEAGDLIPELTVDCRLNPANLSLAAVDALMLMEPFGASNPQPIFGIYGVTITGVRPLAGNKHLRLSLQKQNVNLTALYFGQSPEDFPYLPGDRVDLAVRLERNVYQGQANLSVQIRDIRPAGGDDEALFSALAALARLQRGGPVTEEEKRLLKPDRTLIQKLFLYIKNDPGCRLSAELLALRMGLKPDEAPRCAAAAAALTELGLLQNDNGALTVVPGARNPLANSNLLRALGFTEER